MQVRLAVWVVGIWFATAEMAGQPLGPLANVAVPRPSNLSKYVADERMLVVLGKALFWDTQAGSDGQLACASCHFHAGADHRAQNQLANAHGGFRPNQRLTLEDFPFRKLENVDNNRSTAWSDSSQVVGSAGLRRRMFVNVSPGQAVEQGYDTGDTPAFSVGGINLRQVTGRNTPSVINAIFNVRNFWDGRAARTFSGSTPFGASDPLERALLWTGRDLVMERVEIDDASLASQAVGPLLNPVEMSYAGRSWEKAAVKMLSLRPLASQRIAPDDSVLGPFVNRNGRGFIPGITYRTLLEAVFRPEYWSGPDSTVGLSQAAWNFPIFWGLAIAAYEGTLVSSDSPFDRFAAGDQGALSPLEQQGMNVFTGRGGCNPCHGGPEFTAASFTSLRQRGPVQQQRQLNADTGFFRLGVRPQGEDVGLGGTDDYGLPLSVALQQNRPNLGVTGAFKAPGLRNVELTGPYFHNGGQATLEQVVDFYSRGGDFPDGGVAIRSRNLSANERIALVAFLKSLTDDRVRFERAPFDHPEICISVGHQETAAGQPLVDTSDPQFSFSGADRWALLPTVGATGNASPLRSFAELLAGLGTDGSRSHDLTESCVP